MTRRLAPHGLEPYRPLLDKWMPAADVRLDLKGLLFDGLLTWAVPGGKARYLIEEKRHLKFQDIQVIVDQLVRRRQNLGPAHAKDRLLLLAPHVRRQQAAALERADIDFIDLVGNARLNVPGLLVHIEGRQAAKEAAAAPGRPQRAWIKAVMALLIRPDLANEPYRLVAEQADVALGTVAQCITDLVTRGLLEEGQGGRRIADRPALVALWVQAYVDVLRPKLKERRFQMRADTKQDVWTRVAATLAARDIPWALTGADAAQRRTPYFRAEETEIYAQPDALTREIQKELVAQPVERGGNLLIIDLPGPLATPLEAADGLRITPDLLAYAELRYRGTQQALEAADLLLPTVLE